ncbi:MAG: hypothetical protein HUJ76_07585, partial [Parasporobacterium sp.]|nr:hypothetical protein [Parasporobacterium sp.]
CPKEQVRADIENAREAAETSSAALNSGDLENAQNLGLQRDYTFDPSKDILNSEDLVVSFVITGGSSQDDQNLFYLVSSAALAILHPDYVSDRDAFDDLKQNLLMLYANNTTDTDYASWISGFGSREEGTSLTIPGNAVECWFATTKDKSLYLDITLYVYYEPLIDVGVAIG